MTKLKPEDRRDRWHVFSNTKPYQNMTKSQRTVFDHAEENGMRGSIRYTKHDIAKWKAKRANMSEEEVLEMEANESRKGAIAGAGFLAVVAVMLIVCVVICIELAA